jgi:hypothetical protein
MPSRLEETMRSASRSATRRHDAGHEHKQIGPAIRLTTNRDASAGSQEPRSSYGTVPGTELPAFVYVSVLAAFAWIMLASWLAFAGDMDAMLALGIAVVLGIVFFALPVIIRQVAVANTRNRPEATDDFLSAPVETATGPLPGWSAWLQILLIPLALALAATLIGAAYVLVR